MQKVISADEMRGIDRLTTERYFTPSILLMEAAGAAAASAIESTLGRDSCGLNVLILCGRGNNGGDGASLARFLYLKRASVNLVLLGRLEETKADARANFDIVRSISANLRNQPEPLDLVPSAFSHSGTLDYREWTSTSDFKEVFSTNRINDYDVVVDALFGTGLSRPLQGLAKDVVASLRGLREARRRKGRDLPLIVSLDIPSGLNADSASIIGEAVQADLTVTFTAPKPANVLPPACELSGRLIVANIGSPASLIEESKSSLFINSEDDVRRWLIRTRYKPGSYKNSHGHALVIAGSRRFAGAPVLCSEAAMRSGAGLVTIATPSSVQPCVTSRVMPEVMVSGLAETPQGSISLDALETVLKISEKATVLAIGPGLTSEIAETRDLVQAIVEGRPTPLVIDADGLNSLAPWPANLRGSAEHPLVLTPHIGEMIRLLGVEGKDALEDRVDAARAFAESHSVILVLKGSRTLVAAPDGRVFINITGNPGLGTAGSGDTLTGIITGFLAQEFASFGAKADALSACLAAVYVGGLAGDLAACEMGMRTMVASDIRDHLSAAIREIDAEGERP